MQNQGCNDTPSLVRIKVLHVKKIGRMDSASPFLIHVIPMIQPRFVLILKKLGAENSMRLFFHMLFYT